MTLATTIWTGWIGGAPMEINFGPSDVTVKTRAKTGLCREWGCSVSMTLGGEIIARHIAAEIGRDWPQAKPDDIEAFINVVFRYKKL